MTQSWTPKSPQVSRSLKSTGSCSNLDVGWVAQCPTRKVGLAQCHGPQWTRGEAEEGKPSLQKSVSLPFESKGEESADAEAPMRDVGGVFFSTFFCGSWWVGFFECFHILGRIIPTDFDMFQRGWNHQPAKKCLRWLRNSRPTFRWMGLMVKVRGLSGWQWF